MSIFHRFKPLVSPVCRGRVLLEHAAVFRRVSSVFGHLPRCHRAEPASCPLSTYYFTSRRWYSEIHSSEGGQSKESGGVIEEETHEDESDVSDHRAHLRERFSESFNLDVVVSLLRQENAVDICVIQVPKDITYAQYVIVGSGISTRHLRAMAFYAVKVYKFLKANDDPNVKIEGKDADDWMCIDFGNMVIHFMLPETREVYELEKLWTLRSYDEQLKRIPREVIPEDFVYDIEASKE